MRPSISLNAACIWRAVLQLDALFKLKETCDWHSLSINNVPRKTSNKTNRRMTAGIAIHARTLSPSFSNSMCASSNIGYYEYVCT